MTAGSVFCHGLLWASPKKIRYARILDAVLSWVSTYGYAAIFGLLVLGIVGLPVPDEWLLVFSGYLVYSGRLNPLATFAAALLGSLCGITASYWIGRKAGLPLVRSKVGRFAHISDQRIQVVHDWFNRIGHWLLFFGYYIPGVRHFTALVAGTSQLEFRPFALYAYTGALGWVSIFLFIGYHFGERWRTVFVLVERNLKTACAAGAAVLVVWLLIRWIRARIFRDGI